MDSASISPTSFSKYPPPAAMIPIPAARAPPPIPIPDSNPPAAFSNPPLPATACAPPASLAERLPPLDRPDRISSCFSSLRLDSRRSSASDKEAFCPAKRISLTLLIECVPEFRLKSPSARSLFITSFRSAILFT